MTVNWQLFNELSQPQIDAAQKQKFYHFSRFIVVKSESDTFTILKVNLLQILWEKCTNCLNRSYFSSLLGERDFTIMSREDIAAEIARVAEPIIQESEDIEALNARMPQGFAIDVCQEEGEDRQPYNLEMTIGMLHSLKTSGQRLGLVLGRKAEQKLPRKDGVIFVSFDNGSGCDFENFPTDRYHIEAGFGEYEEELKGLFNEIILDTSTRKFFPDVVSLAWPLLDKSEDSILVFESRTDLRSLISSQRSLTKCVNISHGSVDNVYDFKANRVAKPPQDLQNLMLERERLYFEQGFKEVTTYGDNVPYPSRIDSNEGFYFVAGYYILKGPKEEKPRYPEITCKMYDQLSESTRELLKNYNIYGASKELKVRKQKEMYPD